MLFIFGFGYSSLATANCLASAGVQVIGTTRSQEKQNALKELGHKTLLYEGGCPTNDIATAIENATALLVSIAPGDLGDPVLNDFEPVLAKMIKQRKLQWIGYFSTVGVYGNHDGAWVDEESQCRPVSERSMQRLAAENNWQSFAKERGCPLAILRLAGIYGPGRNAFMKLNAGKARRIIKLGQVFNRIHVDDIARATRATLQERADGIFNICDNEPAPPQDVVALAANLLGVEIPTAIPFQEADLSPMGRSFYGENKRVSNIKLKQQFDLQLKYPTYREALAFLLKHGWKAT